MFLFISIVSFSFCCSFIFDTSLPSLGGSVPIHLYSILLFSWSFYSYSSIFYSSRLLLSWSFYFYSSIFYPSIHSLDPYISIHLYSILLFLLPFLRFLFILILFLLFLLIIILFLSSFSCSFLPMFFMLPSAFFVFFCQIILLFSFLKFTSINIFILSHENSPFFLVYLSSLSILFWFSHQVHKLYILFGKFALCTMYLSKQQWHQIFVKNESGA